MDIHSARSLKQESAGRRNKIKVYSAWFDPNGTRTHDVPYPRPKASTLTIIPPMRCPVMINASRAENVPVNKRGDSVAKRFGMNCLNLQPYALKCVLQLLFVLVIFPEDTGVLVWQI